ncbi:hypothetical protein [Hyalangium minutum]|uniref:Type II secretory pathway, ATPase PulE/Tfp pilus assembly pathway, ATPase PilB n=1 Tax=Hyalangium minutum TaxID=394096 RepID=A0A085WK93_9BACT|nr:hypothetical protein [Hyalangium minutum]KFE68106.1 Type II secretory pathway, ATPase PulE/Tfp pilus assembly pathway, ATPase PilB [Hyalangium minutum]
MSLDVPFLRSFFRAVTDRPIEFDDGEPSTYVRLYDSPALAPHDPVEMLARPIEFALGSSVQLFSGFRGSGKSTELRRLRQRLLQQGYKVVLCDIEDYLNLSQNVDVSDFLMALAGAFGEGLRAQGYLSGDPAEENYWDRLVVFLKDTEIRIPEVGAGGLLKASLKSDPSFRQKLQERMAGHLGALVESIRTFFSSCIQRIKKKFGQDTEVVLLVDSMEHIRGTSTNAVGVQDSVINLFTSHSDKLQFADLHVVYTIPPYLKVLYQNLGTLYAPGGVFVLPTLKIRNKEGSEVFQPGLDLMEKLISRRGDWRKLLGDNRQTLDEISKLSGGHLRDFLRLFAEIIRRADKLPVPDATLQAAISQVRSEFLPIADKDAIWLSKIAATHSVALPDNKDLHDLARYLDTHLALCYRNGDEWYDVHPLVRDVVLNQAKALTPAPAKP